MLDIKDLGFLVPSHKEVVSLRLILFPHITNIDIFQIQISENDNKVFQVQGKSCVSMLQATDLALSEVFLMYSFFH